MLYKFVFKGFERDDPHPEIRIEWDGESTFITRLTNGVNTGMLASFGSYMQWMRDGQLVPVDNGVCGLEGKW